MVNDSHRDFVITSKILQEIKDIKTFTEGVSLEEYLDDLKTQKAVAMSLINIGELCGAYSQGFLEEYRSIPWRQIRALRNIAAHKYEAISHSDVWETISMDIPELEAVLKTAIGVK